ncbi:diaminopimelate epimerase [Dokdonella immobilis]|uniref:Diaminopimelate epimerase n=1 Tax=Dokdonella immobilis TaxID=578942 RepID=A0A1I4YNF4_9GAMM|nr:diaminopimelate epimerase [Dokdonella immobilis]SFN39130.1 diaminopimelate epimerase [Dokdonella immobilis]
MALAFSKMHGIGNDFVLIDCRERPLPLDTAAIRRIGHRHFGVGFDQLLSIESSQDADCAFAYGVWNSDGSRSGQCGNGVRCVAAWLARDGVLGEGLVRLMSPSGPVRVERLADERIRVDMGEPRFAPAALPFDVPHERDPYSIDVVGRSLKIGAVSMGNPHALVEVADIDAAEVDVLGPQVEHAAEFPRGCNVGFAQVLSRSTIALRVWERGVGETLACGTGACAAVAVLHRRGLLDDEVEVRLPGGALEIQWQGPGHPLWKTGSASFAFEGVWHE